MPNRLKKFVPRAPRYILRTSDRQSMRFSFERSHGTGDIEQTILINLSESGAAFLVSEGPQPKIGERIKVEIPVPKGDQIAWWAKVVRVEEYVPSSWRWGKDPFLESPKILIGLRFEELPEPHSRAIRRGIEKSFISAAREQEFRSWYFYRALLLQHALQALLYVALTAFLIGFVYYFTLPDSKYDAKRGTPWGDRYKW